ncbi:MAG: rhodanese-like domain-containing protein [Proteobacteria bacterium]|nr:rhodanese-like domain-containing protein [Pseudomonadota bacterium]MBU0967388.1 rhodanese-like domain-containing protein [Pseudomonadota bacterium]
MKKTFLKLVPLCLMFALANPAFAADQGGKQTGTQQTQQSQQKEENVYTGQIVGKSEKAKTVSIEVGQGDQAKTMMLKFDEQTKGVEQAVKGHAAIIKFEMRGNNKYATEIKPKLAKLPEGVTEVKTGELQELIKNHTDMFLVDARPESRYGQSHLPGAVSIPVALLQKKQTAALPLDKNKLIVFYCGGPT